MFCAPGLVFDGTEGVCSYFHVLRARTHFRRYRGRQVPFIKFCAPELIFGGTEGVCSRVHVLRARTHFRRYRGPQLPFSYFATQTHFWRYRGRRVLFQCLARPDSFPMVPRASGLIFKFCAPGLMFDGTVGIGSHFHVLRVRTRFPRY
jgi:hypothetical protein